MEKRKLGDQWVEVIDGQEGVMREILFRGKRVDNGEWDYGYLYKEGPQSFILKNGRHYPDVIYGPTPLGILDWCEVLPETVGQFTGLLDKHGRKIFEGDIAVTCHSPLSISKIVGNIHDNPELLSDKKS